MARVPVGFFQVPSNYFQLSEDERLEWASGVAEAMQERAGEINGERHSSRVDESEDWPGPGLPSDHG